MAKKKDNSLEKFQELSCKLDGEFFKKIMPSDQIYVKVFGRKFDVTTNKKVIVALEKSGTERYRTEERLYELTSSDGGDMTRLFMTEAAFEKLKTFTDKGGEEKELLIV